MKKIEREKLDAESQKNAMRINFETLQKENENLK